jgi:hypothetical protein
MTAETIGPYALEYNQENPSRDGALFWEQGAGAARFS